MGRLAVQLDHHPDLPRRGIPLRRAALSHGRLVSPRWRILAWIAVVVSVAVAASTALSDYPIAIAPNVRQVANPIGIRGFATSILGRLWVIYPA